MKYDPKDASSAIPEGTYEATVVYITEVDKEGNPLKDRNGYDMMRVGFDVYVGDVTRKLSQYFSASPMALWRVKKMAEACGLGEKFKSGALQAGDFADKNMRLTLTVKDDPKYGEQNEISAFGASTLTARPASKMEQRVSKQNASTLGDDDIPF
jgi:hypothetical protein